MFNASIQQITKKVNDLFIDTRYTYIWVDKRDSEWKTLNAKNNPTHRYLSDKMIESMLLGKQQYGVFGRETGSKFITFDVDYSDDIQMAKWVTMKVVNELENLGVPQDKIYVSYSGSKGFHVDLYFTESVSFKKLHALYQLVCENIDLTPKGREKVKYEGFGGEVELRPIKTKSGVKLPLGIHHKTKNRCWYVDAYNRFTEYDYFEYILIIEQLNVDVIDTILEEQDDLMQERKEVAETKSYIEERYTPLASYKVGVDEEATIEEYEKLESEGLKRVGTRTNSLFKLARYYKHLGLTQDENRQALITWMSEQDTRMYTTKFQNCLKDIENIVNYVYKNDVGIVVKKDYVNVSYAEMVEIIKAKTKNQKLILFSMLIHSKRYADKNGVFYMTVNQLEQTTGIADKNVRNNVKKLQEQELINIVASNVQQKGTFLKKPNKYKVLINVEDNGLQVDCNTTNIEETFNKVLVELIPLEVVKKELPRRHYEEIRAYYKAV